MPHNDVLVNDGPHIRWCSHNIVILQYHVIIILTIVLQLPTVFNTVTCYNQQVCSLRVIGYNIHSKWVVKVKCTRRRSRGIALFFMTKALEEGEGSASRPGRSLPPGKTRYPL